LPLFFFWSSCGYKTELDNASEVSVDIRIDNETYSLDAGETKSIRLKEGKHILKLERQPGIALDTSIEFQSHSELFIHLPGQKYLIWRDLYGNQNKRAEILNEIRFELDSVIYKVDIKYLDTLKFIHEKEWDLGITENFEDQIILREDQNEGIRSKLLREKKFAKEYQKQAQH